MDKNKVFIELAKFSLVFGMILGAFAVIPYINILAILTMSVFASVVVIFYFQHNDLLGELSMKGGAVLGAIIGVVVSCGFLAIALPFYAILSYIPFINRHFALVRDLWQLSWLLLPMLWIVVAPLNSATLMGYIYIRDTFFMINPSKQGRSFNPDFYKKEN